MKVHNPTNKAMICGPFVLQSQETALFIPDVCVAFKMQGAIIQKDEPKPKAVKPPPPPKPVVEFVDTPVKVELLAKPEVKVKRKYTRRTIKED